MKNIYDTPTIRIEIEDSEIPWLKIFTKTKYKEMSEVPQDIKIEIFQLLDILEKKMISYYQPTKINIASFGNYVPIVHWHIMARFNEDSFFPEPMWGTKQRDAQLDLPPFDTFIKELTDILNTQKKYYF